MKTIALFLCSIFLLATISFANTEAKKIDSAWMLEMNSFAESQKLTADFKLIEKHFSAKGKNFKCSFVVGLSYFSVQGKVIPLSHKTVLDENGKVWVPVQEALPEFEKAFNVKFYLDSAKSQITTQAPKTESTAKIQSSSSVAKSISSSSLKASTKNIPDDRSAKAGSREVRTIIIDPGHGGKDPGAQGLKSNEKDIVLAVAHKLKADLEEAGFEVKLTRDKDVFIELGERPNLANKWNGDLFISLHCNAIEGDSIKHRKTKGYHFYVLRAPESEEDKAIARRENKVAALYGDKKAKTDISPIEWIKIQASLEVYQKNSFNFTEKLLKSFEKGSTKRLGQGAGGAGFMVLVGALMPATLVELGFITNPDDEAFMNSEAGQKELSGLIKNAVEAYREGVHAYRETLTH